MWENNFIDLLRRVAGIKAEGVLYKKRRERGGGLKFCCEMCGCEFGTERSVERHIRRKHSDEVVKATFKEALRGMRKGPKDIEGLNILIEGMDVKKLEELDVDFETAEGIARMFNEVFFHGDWRKHAEWIKTYGSEEQRREDIPLIEKIMKENIKGK